MNVTFVRRCFRPTLAAKAINRSSFSGIRAISVTEQVFVFHKHGGMVLKEAAMDAETFLRLINEIDFVLDDIAELKDQLQLTKSESNRLSRAVAKIEESKDMLRQLFPAIRSLEESVREELEAELAEID